MKIIWNTVFLGIALICFQPSIAGQSLLDLESCGISYIDPQDELGNTAPSQDTLRYSFFFQEENQLRNFFVDINAFGGSQIDRVNVYAILPGNELKDLGGLAFGTCIDCVSGFALVNNDSLLVSDVTDIGLMEMWLISFGQPEYALPGNLQTRTQRRRNGRR